MITQGMPKNYTYPRISQEEYASLKGHMLYNIKAAAYSLGLDKYGLDEGLKILFSIIEEQAEQFGMAVRGKPAPPMLSPEWQRRIKYNADD